LNTIRIQIPQTLFKAGEVRELSAEYLLEDSRILKPTYILIPSAYAFNFAVLSIKCKDKEQFKVPNPIPSELFRVGGFAAEVTLDTIDIASDFKMKLENMSNEPRYFQAEIVCECLFWTTI
jgi:hypothetical protein